MEILRHRIRFTLIAAVTLVLTACTATGPTTSQTTRQTTGQTLQETRQLELAIPADTLLRIEAGAGSLSLHGEAGTDVIRVEAEIWRVTPGDDYTLTLELEDNGAARLVTRGGAGATDERIDLDIRVPESIRLDVSDGAGSLEIAGIAGPLFVRDGSGSIRIDDIGADITIQNDSGSLRVENTDGHLRIEDGPGSITVRNTAGDVVISDGAGSISVTGTAGVVTISDASGSISVDGAEDFELLDDGGGRVNLENIRSNR